MNINNNLNSPNFGMLKIKPKAKEDLMNASTETLLTIEKYGKELEDTVGVDLIIEKGLVPKINIRKAIPSFRPPFEIEPIRTMAGWDGAYSAFSGKWAGAKEYTPVSGRYRYGLCFDSREDAIVALRKVENSESDIAKAGELVKIISNHFAKKYKEGPITMHDSARKSLANDLYERYSS